MTGGLGGVDLMPMYKSGPGDKIAYTVRPDLWPPGTYCWLVARPDVWLAVVASMDWVRANVHRATTFEAPGAAEALILAGHQVRVSGERDLTSIGWEPLWRAE